MLPYTGPGNPGETAYSGRGAPGGWPVRRSTGPGQPGRYTLLAMAVLYGIGAIATSMSWNLGSFLAFRILTGIAVGASSLVVPAYIAELSPVSIRGGLVILQQLAISGGILDLLRTGLRVRLGRLGMAADVRGRGAARPRAERRHADDVAFAPLAGHAGPLGRRGRWSLERIDPRHKQQEIQLLHRNVEESAGTSWARAAAPGPAGRAHRRRGPGDLPAARSGRTRCCSTPDDLRLRGRDRNPLLPTIYVGAVLFVFVFPTIAFVDIVGRKSPLLPGPGRDGIDAGAAGPGL